MVHEMKLVNSAFESIKKGTKDIELRINDEKRQKIKINDYIIFTNLENNEKLKVLVTHLHYGKTFEEIYMKFDKVRFGYDIKEEANFHDMEEIYPVDKILKYGALAIEIKVVK